MIKRITTAMHGGASRNRGSFQFLRLTARLSLYTFSMVLTSHKALRVGLGFRGLIGAMVLGIICLFPPLFGTSKSLLWAKILLVLAALVYVFFSLAWDKKFISLSTIQFLVALVLLGASLLTEKIYFVTFGLFCHAMWDVWHLATQKRYVPWWYAGACVYVDLIAVLLLLIKY